MWVKDNRTENEILIDLCKDLSNHINVVDSSRADFIMGEMDAALLDSKNAVHCFFSPSKSNGWVVCPAYLSRQQAWNGSKEPAVRGTIMHHFLSRTINQMKDHGFDSDVDTINYLVFQSPEWLSDAGAKSVLALLSRIAELGFDKTLSEVFLVSEKLGYPNKNLLFGGSIDVLIIDRNVDGKSAKCYLYDLKTGKHPVSPNAWQLKCYALLVTEWLERSEGITRVAFELGIAQNGKLSVTDFSDEEEQNAAYAKIKEAISTYVCTYKLNNLDEADDDTCKVFQNCFAPNSYCRFCKGCYKRDLVEYL